MELLQQHNPDAKGASLWERDNLDVVSAHDDPEGPRQTCIARNPEKNAHVHQWCEPGAVKNAATLAFDIDVWADAPEKVGVNLYLYFHPTDDSDRSVYQRNHPGDGMWHQLAHQIPWPDRTIYRIRFLIVARAGAGEFRVGAASLRAIPEGEAAREATLRYEHISTAYHDAVLRMVENHPSADPAFREKLTRYLLGTNRNGMAAIATVATSLPDDAFVGCRFLDLGSGSGGSLVGALRAGAAYAEGWEINGEKRALSEVNVGSCGFDPHRVAVHDRSMEAPHAEEGDGPFDVVFCEEVLEHVKDLDAAIATLARCIGPTGVGYITMPNGYALQSVLADPHLQLFGIALLDRFAAQPLATALKNHTHYSDMMGQYGHYDDYVGRFDRVGLALTPVESIAPTDARMKQWADDLAQIETRYRDLRRNWGTQVDDTTLALLETRLVAYIEEARHRLDEANADPSRRDAFGRDYGQAHFALLARHRE